MAAASAADVARTDYMARYEAATVFVTVTSQVARWPSRQGIVVKPSGRLPSDLFNPFGSLTEGIPSLVIARQTRSLMKWCRYYYHFSFEQYKKCCHLPISTLAFIHCRIFIHRILLECTDVLMARDRGT